MPSISYDSRSFMLDQQRIWLVSGAVHYFRTPAALWPDRLLKAKRAGLNCIETYVAWNFHEPQEGKWDFTGDRDLVGFVKQAQELGLYVILRPGPYICAEWDFGGLPGWLTTKTGIAYRTSNAAFTHYYDKYFRQVLPRLADLQVTRGGNIVLIQNENEYMMTTMPDRLAYLEFITQLFRRAGFEIPVITCNQFSEPPVPETIECVNGWDNLTRHLKRLRLRQPNWPLLVTEFWDGWFDAWGTPHQRRGDRETARRMLEILGCGGQYNCYMWHGGTNFGFWGSKLAGDQALYQTTSYDYDAPLAEGGGLTNKYYLTRLVNVLASSLGRTFASCTMESPGVSIHNGSETLNIAGPAGSGWGIVTNNGRDEIDVARVSLPGGKELDVSLAALGATAVPVKIPLTATHVLDYSSLMPLGFFEPRTLVLHGPADAKGVASVNGQEIALTVPAGETPTVLEHQGLQIVVVSTPLATRTWPAGESLVIGPEFVGADPQAVVCGPSCKTYTVLALGGEMTTVKVKPAEKKPAVPAVSQWKRLGVCTEPVQQDLPWQKMDRPRDVDHLGVSYGYVWYRCEFEQASAGRKQLFFPECEDRATIYLNGSLLGTWGRGEGAAREPIVASLPRGKNVLTLLLDNLGRRNFGPSLGLPKGLFGHVYDVKPLKLPKLKLQPLKDFSKRIIPRHLAHLAGELEKGPVWVAEISLNLTSVCPIHLSFAEVPHHVAVICNERTSGFFPNLGKNFGDLTLGPELKKGKNLLRLMLWGEAAEETLAKFRFHLLQESLTEGGSWGYRPWVMPKPGDYVVGKNQPAWYVASFARPQGDEPLFLRIAGAKKGQIFLNGHNAGRFWSIGPQEYYYLPSCWLAEANELVLFEEQGLIPSGSRLEFRPQGPYRE